MTPHIVPHVLIAITVIRSARSNQKGKLVQDAQRVCSPPPIWRSQMYILQFFSNTMDYEAISSKVKKKGSFRASIRCFLIFQDLASHSKFCCMLLV